MEKIIEVTCKIRHTLPLDSIMEFQGQFKERDQYDIENIIKSLIKYGISFPFFIWKDGEINYCLDGHGRKLGLVELRNREYTIPGIPVVYIKAANRAEALQKMLRLNSRYGTITHESVLRFTEDIQVDFDEIAIPDTETIDFAGMPKNLESFFTSEEKPKEKKVKHCPYCGEVIK